MCPHLAWGKGDQQCKAVIVGRGLRRVGREEGQGWPRGIRKTQHHSASEALPMDAVIPDG